MKKFLAIATILCMVPFTAFALDMITDNELDAVTGQSGVTIVFSGNQTQGALSMNVGLNGMAWGDTDGVQNIANVAGGDQKGYFTLNGFDAQGNAQKTTMTIKIEHLSQMTLDVGTTSAQAKLTVDGSDVVPTAKTFIRMGIPDLTLEMNMAQKGKLVLADNSAGTNGQELGELSLTGLTVGLVFPENSALYIFAH